MPTAPLRPSNRPQSSANSTLKRRNKLSRWRFAVERLEDRLAPALVQWIAGSGNWNTGSNWSGGAVPGSADDVYIPAGITVTHSSGTHSIQSLESAAPISLSGGAIVVTTETFGFGPIQISGGTFSFTGTDWSNSQPFTMSSGTLNLGGTFATDQFNGFLTRTGGTLNLTGTVNNSAETLTLNAATGSLTLAGGTINNGTVSTSGGAKLVTVAGSNGTLNAVTLNGELETPAFSNGLYITNGFTLNGTATMASSLAGLAFKGSSLFDGNATVTLTGGGSFCGVYLNDPNTTLTIGSGIIVNGSAGYVGQYSGGPANQSVINNGTVGATAAGNGIILSGANWTNNGTIIASGGGTTHIAPTNWSNVGAINVNAGIMNLGGTFTPANINGKVTRTGGSLRLTGILNNAGATLTLDGGTGSLALLGGTINQGTITTSAGAKLMTVAGLAGTLNAVTLNGELDTPATSNGIYITNGFTLNGTATMASSLSGLAFKGSSSFNGAATVTLTGGGSFCGVYLNDPSTTLTIGSGITINGSAGYVGQYSGGPANQSVINNGTVGASSAGNGIILSGATWTNVGAIVATGGGTTSIAPTTWTNTGLITVNAGILNLGGTFSSADINGKIARSGGSLRLNGTMNNAASTLTLNATTGSLSLVNGTVDQGTIVTTGGAKVTTVAGFNSTLNAVTLNGDLDMPASTSGVYVTNGFTLNGTATLASNFAGLNFKGSQTFGGNATVTMTGGGSFCGVYLNDAGTTLTIGSGIMINGSAGYIGQYNGGPANQSVINNGTVGAHSAGNGIILSGANWTNNATIFASGGGTAAIAATNWTNAATLSINAGTLNLGGTFTSADVNGKIARTGGTLNLTGTLANSASTLTLNATTGSLRMAGTGKIDQGTVATSGGSQLILTGGACVLNGVTINGAFSMPDGGGPSANITNGLTLNGTGTFSGNDSHFNIIGSSTIGGNGTITFSSVGNFHGLLLSQGSTSLTIGAGMTIEGGILVSYNGAPAGLSVVNHGTIGATTSGRSSTIIGDGFTNFGTVVASGGGTVNINTSAMANSGALTATNGTISIGGAWTNTGSIAINGGIVNLGGTFSSAAINGKITRTGGTLNLTGILNNSASTLTLDAAMGSLALADGTINQGTIVTTGGAKLTSADTIYTGKITSTLNGVTLNGDFFVSGGLAAGVFITNGLTVNGTVTLSASNAGLAFVGSKTLGGNATVTMTAGGSYCGVWLYDQNTTLTIGAGITINGSAGYVGQSPSNAQPNLSVINNGTVGATASGFGMTLAGKNWTNNGNIVASGSGTTSLSPTNWTNPGTLVINNGTLILGGTFPTSAINGKITRTGGTLRLDGTMNNAGDTLTLNAATGSLLFGSGTINQGTISATGSSKLTFGSGTLNAVTYNGDINITADATSLYLTNGFTLNGTITMTAGNSLLRFIGSQTLSGNGTVSLSNGTAQGIYVESNSTTLTIGAGITIAGGAGFVGQPVGGGLTNISVINHGTVFPTYANGSGLTLNATNWTNAAPSKGNDFGGRLRLQLSSATMTVTAGTFTNLGLIAGTAGVMDFNPTTFSNQGTVIADGGEVRVRPTTTNSNFTNTTLSGNTYSTTLIGGAWALSGAGVLRLFQGTDTTKRYQITRLKSNLNFDGPSTAVFGGAAGSGNSTFGGLNSLANIDSDGRLVVDGGAAFNAFGPVTNAGYLYVGPGSVFGAPTSPTGLVSRYSATGNANDSVGTNHGSAQNGATFTTGIVGQGFSLDGVNDQISIPDSPSLRNANMTVEGWFQFTSSPGGLVHLFGKPLGNGNQDSYGVWYNAGVLNAGISDGAFDFLTTAYTPDVGVWHHVALTFSDVDNKLSLYLDGALRNSIASNRTIAYDTRPHLFGADIENTSPNYFFPGVIDEVGLFNRALSPSEVETLYIGAIKSGLSLTSTGSTIIDGILNAPNGVSLTAGFVSGGGKIQGSVTNAASIQPGASPGTLTIAGNYTQTAAGILTLEFGGKTKLTDGDLLDISGTATLNGTVKVTLLNGLGPNAGQMFTSMKFAGKSGDFSTYDIQIYNGTAVFNSSFTATSFELTAPLAVTDLTFGGMAFPRFAVTGQTIGIGLTINNGSITPAVGSWSDSIYLSLDNTLDAGDILFGQFPHTATVPSFGSYTSTLYALVPGIPGEDYHVFIVPDEALVLPELERPNLGISAATTAINLDNFDLILNQVARGSVENTFAVDRWKFSASAGQQVRLHKIHMSSPTTVKFKIKGPGGYIGFTNVTDDSGIITLPSAGQYILEASSSGGSGDYNFRLDQTNPTLLTLGNTYNGLAVGDGYAQLFQVNLTSATPLKIAFDGATNTDRFELFAKLNNVPNRQETDVRIGSPGSDHVLLVPLAAPGAYYIVVYGEAVPAASNFTLRVDSTAVGVTGSTPSAYPNTLSDAVLTVQGLGFQPGTQISLVPTGGGSPTNATSMIVNTSNQVSATFNLLGLASGSYDVKATLPGGFSTDTLVGAFQVSPGVAVLETKIILPTALGRRAAATIYVEYANTGTAAMPAPVLVLESADPEHDENPLLTLDQNLVKQGLWGAVLPVGLGTSVEFYASGRQAGFLLPGERVRIPVQYVGQQLPWETDDNDVEFQVRVHDVDDDGVINWAGLQTQLKPAWITAEAWPAVYANVQIQIGSTWGDYVQMLNRNAAYLGRFGQSVANIKDLYGFEVQKAVGLDPIGALTTALDASMPTPGVALQFVRSFGNTINSRYTQGVFGRGWDASWLSYLEFVGGSVIVHESANGLRRFDPDSRGANRFFSQTGDTGSLKLVSGGAFEMTEANGSKTRFTAGGRLEYIQDTNGNRITVGYTGANLTTLTHTSGATLAIAYNGENLISSITDSAGRTTTYTYDLVNKLLLSATGPGGTTSYTYSVGNGIGRQFALLSVTGPDTLTAHFDYDARGRIAASYLDGNADRVNYTYDNLGQVTSTDLTGVYTRSYFDARGLLVRGEDALGHFVVHSYNGNRQLAASVDDAGRSVTFTRSDSGRPKTITDIYGRTILTFTQGGPYNSPLAFTDANGNQTQYQYDARGNMLKTTYPNATFTQSTYDSAGNLDVVTNRRGQTNDHTVNAAGQVTNESRSDSTTVARTYDSRGRLATATNAQGTTTFSYNTADRLTRVDYPNGRWIEYTYDLAGRRTKVKDNSLFETNYAYDAAGRLSQVRDAANVLLVAYTYNSAGRVSREDKGNGTYTIYGYDAAGRQTSIVNHAPGGAVNSQFLYSYDAAGNRTTETTIDGTWTFSYDVTGQLSLAVFASTNVNIPSQSLAYNYDGAGNLMQTVLNGVTTNYVVNAMNQYTSAGAKSFQYDLDGNLTQETGPGGSTTFGYDILNRLISVQSPTTLTQYEYDVLGNRTAVTVNGVRTEYLVDPSGLGTIVGEYNGLGVRTSSYAQAQGLAGSQAGGVWRYYDFDALGSTSGITGAAGTYVNQYAYGPWGDKLLNTETVANPFGFVGEFGVMEEANGLKYMRARYHSPTLARFTSEDPIGLNSGEINTHTYAFNNPINRVDIDGKAATTTNPTTNVSRDLNAVVVTTGDDGVTTQQLNPTTNVAADSPTPPIPTTPRGIKGTRCATGVDPNEKFGSAGVGPQSFIDEATAIPYRINFENLGLGTIPTPMTPATAPVHRAEVSDQLSTNLDWNTFQFSEFGFGDNVILVPAGLTYYFTTVEMTYNDQFFIVEVELHFDATTGLIRAVFQSIDPQTTLPPDVLTGFLPPENGTGVGKAHVSYSVKPVAGLATQTQIRNIAEIRFDYQRVIATNQVNPEDVSAGTNPNKEALNTIDALAPTSTVQTLAANTNTLSFNVQWSGADEVGGSGLAYYDVYVSDTNGPFTLWQSGTTAVSAVFTGVDHHSYSFYSVASDFVGHRQATPNGPQASTLVTLPPRIAAVIVNGGGSQRSRVTSLNVVFSESVTFPNGIGGAFQFNRTGPGSPTGSVLVSAMQSGNVVTLTFLPGGGVGLDTGNGLIDGIYQLTVLSGDVQGIGGLLDGDNNSVAGGNFATPTTGAGRIHRLFGDGNADGKVDSSDFILFRATFNSLAPNPLYNFAYDSNDDGKIDSLDFIAFRTRFNSSL